MKWRRRLPSGRSPHLFRRLLTELHNRSAKDIFIACLGGLKGSRQAIGTVFPKITVQSCMVPTVCASLNFVNWKERKERKQVARHLKSVYRAAAEEEAGRQLAKFTAELDEKYPSIGALRRWNLPVAEIKTRRLHENTSHYRRIHRC